MTAPGLARSKPLPAAAVRSITILGATGSIGASTIDLIKREPDRYRVEALSARRNAAALAKIAREVGARFAVVADPAAYGDLKDALGRQRHRGGGGRGRSARSGAAAGRLGDGGDQRRGRTEADAGRDRARRHRRARQQGMSGLRRRLVHAPRGERRRDRAAGRLRAQRDVPGARRRPRARTSSA